MSLESQFESISQNWYQKIKNQYQIKAELILQNGLKIFKESIPVDTEQLKESIKGEVKEISNGFEIIIQIPNTELSYKGKTINAIKLGLILERGLGKSGAKLTRRKSNIQEFTKQGSPTAQWFDKAFKKWEESIKL